MEMDVVVVVVFFNYEEDEEADGDDAGRGVSEPNHKQLSNQITAKKRDESPLGREEGGVTLAHCNVGNEVLWRNFALTAFRPINKPPQN